MVMRVTRVPTVAKVQMVPPGTGGRPPGPNGGMNGGPVIGAMTTKRYCGTSSVTWLPEPSFVSHAQSSVKLIRPSGSVVMVV